ncbi:MAG TPA: glycosyltransferase, partial [Planctomycetota bacterium]|nr:glycosyltransferase [Planctomycetota bacterium]
MTANAVLAPELSVVVPVRDEAANLPLLFEELREVLDALGRRAEIVFVDDGSSDGSVEVVRRLAARGTRPRRPPGDRAPRGA